MKATTGSGMLEALQALENETRVVFYALQAQRKIGGERSVEDFCAYSSAYQNAEVAYEKFKAICDEVLAEKKEAEEKAAQEQAMQEAAHNGVLFNDPLAALIAQAGEVPTVNDQDAALGFIVRIPAVLRDFLKEFSDYSTWEDAAGSWQVVALGNDQWRVWWEESNQTEDWSTEEVLKAIGPHNTGFASNAVRLPQGGYDAPTMAGNEASPDDYPPATGHSFMDGEWTREEIEKHANAAIDDQVAERLPESHYQARSRSDDYLDLPF